MKFQTINRRRFLGVTLASTAALALPKLSWSGEKHSLLDKFVSVDSHTHPGQLYKKGKSASVSALSAIRESQLTAVVFSIPVDIPLMGKSPRDITREPKAGELYAYTFDQLNRATEAIKSSGLSLITSPDELKTVKANNGHGVILAIEGGDFAEDKPEAIEEAYKLGVRLIQPGHFRSNHYTDLQTAKPKHDGLSSDGKKFIEELNRLGIIVDVAHMSTEAVYQASQISSTPLLSSHTLLLGSGKKRKRSRAIDVKDAKLIANSGGAIGVWSYSNKKIPSSMEFFIEQYKKLSSEIGSDNVMMGTDLGSGGFKVGWMNNYNKMPDFVDGLLDAGFTENEVGKILGGNFLRVFEAVAEKRA
jgi:membrane dipeptidase